MIFSNVWKQGGLPSLSKRKEEQSIQFKSKKRVPVVALTETHCVPDVEASGDGAPLVTGWLEAVRLKL